MLSCVIGYLYYVWKYPLQVASYLKSIKENRLLFYARLKIKWMTSFFRAWLWVSIAAATLGMVFSPFLFILLAVRGEVNASWESFFTVTSWTTLSSLAVAFVGFLSVSWIQNPWVAIKPGDYNYVASRTARRLFLRINPLSTMMYLYKSFRVVVIGIIFLLKKTIL